MENQNTALRQTISKKDEEIREVRKVSIIESLKPLRKPVHFIRRAN